MTESVAGGHITLMMTNGYCQALGFLDEAESHKKHSPIDNMSNIYPATGL
ncbi:hypothetical protein MUO65_01695 [bacterium]|nr:hypothetical protein [bacterium]